MPYNTKEKRNAYLAGWRERNRAKIRSYSSEWKASDPERQRRYRKRSQTTIRNAKLRQKYGSTLLAYNQLLEEQGGVCAICGSAESIRSTVGEIRALCLDHNHKSGEPRGLVCSRCNTMLGMVNESRDTLLSAVAYLDRWSNA